MRVCVPFLFILNLIVMKVLVATEKPFAKVAVDGIRKEVEAAGTNWLYLKNIQKKHSSLKL